MSVWSLSIIRTHDWPVTLKVDSWQCRDVRKTTLLMSYLRIRSRDQNNLPWHCETLEFSRKLQVNFSHSTRSSFTSRTHFNFLPSLSLENVPCSGLSCWWCQRNNAFLTAKIVNRNRLPSVFWDDLLQDYQTRRAKVLTKARTSRVELYKLRNMYYRSNFVARVNEAHKVVQHPCGTKFSEDHKIHHAKDILKLAAEQKDWCLHALFRPRHRFYQFWQKVGI